MMNSSSIHFFRSERDGTGAEKTISSLKNPRIKQVLKLRTRTHRDETGLMLIEGKTELKRALENGIRILALFYCMDRAAAAVDPIISLCRESGANIFSCSPGVFQKAAYRNQPEGMIAVAPQFKFELERLRPSSNPLVVVAESLEKPGNLGAILRAADGAGADAVIICDHRTDIYNPNVVRASLGTVFSMPVIEASSRDALAWLRRNKIRILAATPRADTDYIETDLCAASAIVVGAEHDGLSSLWMREADIKARIPMLGQADSLNVAAAATILLFESVRQRKKRLDENTR